MTNANKPNTGKRGFLQTSALMATGAVVGCATPGTAANGPATPFAVPATTTPATADTVAEIAHAIEDHLKPRGVAVLVEASHMCISMRGIQKEGVSTITSGFTGVFHDEPTEQARFMMMVRGHAG